LNSESTTTASVSVERIPELDAVRGLAILMVLSIHLLHVPGGWIGVDIFFVLSGFLITNILVRTLGSPTYYRRFYRRRTFRILPIFCIVYVLGLLSLKSLRESWWVYAYLADFAGFFTGPHEPAFEHTWSLAVEEQFYLVWPVVVALLPKRQLVVAATAALAGAIAMRLVFVAHGAAGIVYAFPIFLRCDGLLVGALLALLSTSRTGRATITKFAPRVALASAAAVLLLAVTKNMSFSHPTGWNAVLALPSISVGSAAFIWMAITRQSSILTSVLNWRWLCGLGTISYGVYLYHMPILEFIQRSGWGSGNDGVFLVALICGAVVLAVSTLSWVFVERPLIEWNNRAQRASGAAVVPALTVGEYPA
jgi:peptidoglycan/LPS O-acetylase OafA/YrhL